MTPKTALWMMAISDGLCALCFGAWKLGLTRHESSGIDPFAGWVAYWFVAFIVLMFVEFIAIIAKSRRSDRRPITWIATAVWLAQLFILRYLLDLIAGV